MAEFDEDSHPRDERGRFSGGGGGGGGASAKQWARSGPARERGGGSGASAKEWAGGGSRPAPKHESIGKAPLQGKREWTGTKDPEGFTYSGQLVGNGKQTIDDHFVGGKPTPERAAFHEREIIGPALAGKKTAKELGEKPVAILTMGGPASGKGVVLGQLEKHGLDKSHFVHVDPDEVKGMIPEYQKSVPQPAYVDKDGRHVPGRGGLKGDGTGPTFRGAAAQAHEESSYVAKQIRQRAIDGGHHVVIDGTGGDSKKFVGMIEDLKSRGYDVHVHYPRLDVNEGVKRAADRAEKTGRFVPENFIRDTYASIDKAFPEIMRAAPNLTVYDAGTRGHPVAHTKRADAGHRMVPVARMQAEETKK